MTNASPPGEGLKEVRMSDLVKLGQQVPDFEVETYDPSKEDFGRFGLKEQRDGKRWTILFFYPADFTFV